MTWNKFVEQWHDKLLKPDIDHREWLELETEEGETFIYPADLFTKEQVLKLHKGTSNIEQRAAWGARMSAPGYLDCTQWVLFETEEEAKEYLMENFGDD